MNYASKHSQDHDDSEYVSYMGVDCMRAEFINKKTYRHLTLYITVLEIM